MQLYLILIGDLFVGEVGDWHLVVAWLADLMLGPLAGLASVEEVSQGLVVNFNKACCEGELRQKTDKFQCLIKMLPSLISTTD